MSTQVHDGGAVPTPYSGTDNLEVMAEARRYNAFLLDLVLRHADADDRRAVDFGAGLGTFALAARDRGLEVTCVELDDGLRKRLAGQGLAVSRTLDELPDGSLPYIYTLNVLEHIEDDQAVLRTMIRKLRPGGRLLVYVPAFAVLFTGMDHKVGHVRRYRRGALCRAIEQAGFAVSSAAYVDSLGFAATLAYRMFGDGGGSLNPAMIAFYDTYLFPLSRGFDMIFARLLGKNVVVAAQKPARRPDTRG